MFLQYWKKKILVFNFQVQFNFWKQKWAVGYVFCVVSILSFWCSSNILNYVLVFLRFDDYYKRVWRSADVVTWVQRHLLKMHFWSFWNWNAFNKLFIEIQLSYSLLNCHDNHHFLLSFFVCPILDLLSRHEVAVAVKFLRLWGPPYHIHSVGHWSESKLLKKFSTNWRKLAKRIRSKGSLTFWKQIALRFVT